MSAPGNHIEPAYAAAMPAPQGGALPTGMEWQALERMATTLAESDVIPYRLKRKPADVAVILLAAREYGIPPLMALSKLPVVNGTPAPMGELMVALILRAGHYIAADFRNPDGTVYKGGPITEGSYGECRYRRREWPKEQPTEALTFTIDEALTAGLIDELDDGRAIARTIKTKNGKEVEEVGPWEQYTPNMARWRAVANVGRLAFADVLMGLSYLPEELGARVDADGAPVLDAEVVNDAPRQRTAAGGTLEQRTAQEHADRLVTFVGPLEVLDNVLAHAIDNGYADARIVYPPNTPGTMAFRDAVARRKDELKRTVVEQGDRIVDVDKPETPADAPSATPQPEPAPADTSTPPEAPAAAQDADVVVEEFPASAPGVGPFGERADTAPEPETPEAAAWQFARDALYASTAEDLRQLYRAAGSHQLGDLKRLDVLPVLGDDDLAALDLPHSMTNYTLGALIVYVSRYVDKHGTAVRDALEPDEATPPDHRD